MLGLPNSRSACAGFGEVIVSWDLSLLTFFVVAWLAYRILWPDRDYYVLQRLYFQRLFEDPWRGNLLDAHYYGFMDYLPAKVVFDLYEGKYMYMLDTMMKEAEHTLFLVPAKSKSAAIARIKAGKAYDKESLHYTRHSDIIERRKTAKETFEATEKIEA